MRTEPLVSVIMPAYNCEKYVRTAIDSVLQQTFADFELLIADDCSKDTTRAIIDSYTDRRIKKFHNPSNQGYLVASNLLLEKAKGSYIVFQDADDYAAPDRFEKLLGALQSDQDLYAVGSNVVTIDDADRVLGHSQFPTTHNDIFRHISNYSNPLVGSALMFKREVLDTIGYYNLYFNRIGWEDIYWFSLIAERYKVANLSEPLYFYRANPHSVSNANKSFRSVVGFDVCSYYMKERLANREDHIKTHNWKKADEMMVRFYISHRVKERSKLSIQEIYKMTGSFLSTLKLYLYQVKNFT